MSLTADHISTLKRLSHLLRDCQDPWWVLGSAAIALSGVDPNGVRDLDVLVSPGDSERLMGANGFGNEADGGNALFRSDILLLPDLGGVPVEIMSNYYIKAAKTWHLLAPKTRKQVAVDGTVLYVPELAEQIEILRALGRPKDLERAAVLKSAL